MANVRKIEINTPDLLVKYRGVVRVAAERGVREALAKHKAAGNPVAVSRNGSVVILRPDEIVTATSSLDAIWNNDEDDAYAELPP